MSEEIFPFTYDKFQELVKEVKELRQLVIDQGERIKFFETQTAAEE